MSPLTVIHSCPVWLPRTQTWMYEQAEHLPAGVTPHVVCERTENLAEFALPHLHCLADGPRWRLQLDRLLRGLGVRRHLGHLPRVARRVGARVLHSHFGHIGWHDLGAARRAGLRHVVTFYGQDVTFLPRSDPRWRQRYRSMFASVDRVLCEGPHMASRIAELGCPEPKLVVHHLGVPLGRYPFRPRNWSPERPLRVLLAGSFTEKKGFPDALRALAALRPDVALEITLVGDANDKPRNQREKQRMLEILASTGLGEVTRLCGYQPHARLQEEIYAHDVLLSPSVTAADGDTEGGAPVTLIEAAATGMPIVSTRHCDIPEVLPDGTAWLADERDVDGLVRCLRELAAAPGHWPERLSRARRHVERSYDARLQGEALAALYRQLAG